MLSSNIHTQNCIYSTCLSPSFVWSFNWGGKYNIHTDKLRVLKKKIRGMYNAQYNSHTENMFKVLSLFRLDDIHTNEVFKFMYNFVNSNGVITSLTCCSYSTCTHVFCKGIIFVHMHSDCEVHKKHIVHRASGLELY